MIVRIVCVLSLANGIWYFVTCTLAKVLGS